MKKVTLCITCYSKDVHFLDQCLHYVNLQTVKPDEILVIANDIQDDSDLKQESLEKGFNLFTTKEHKFPGWGRNVGFNLAKHEIVSFLDVDDIVFPRKIELVKKVFEDESVDALVHNYHYLTIALENVEKKFHYDVEEIKDVGNDVVKTKHNEDVHHGHMTCKKSVYEKYQYREDMLREEDVDFCRRIIWDDELRFFFSPMRLIIYTG